MGLGWIFSGKWIVELLIDANFLSWAFFLAYLITWRVGFLLAFLLTWLGAVGVGIVIQKKYHPSEINREVK